MLGNRFLARNAFSHSPSRERRESYFAKSNGGRPVPPTNNDPQNSWERTSGIDPDIRAVNEEQERREQERAATGRIEDVRQSVRSKAGKGVKGGAPQEQQSEQPGREGNLTRVNRDIAVIQKEVHERVDALIGDILNLRLPNEAGTLLREHSVTQGKPFSLEQSLNRKRSEIHGQLTRRLQNVLMNTDGWDDPEEKVRLQDRLESQLQNIRRHAFSEMAGLEEFKRHIENIAITQIPDQLPSELGKKGLGRIRGFYNQRENRVYMGNDLHGLERPDVLQHELGHAILAGAEFYLDAHVYNRILNAGDEAEKVNAAFNQLRTTDLYKGVDADAKLIERYMEDHFHRSIYERSQPLPHETVIFDALNTRERLQVDISDEKIADDLLRMFKGEEVDGEPLLDRQETQRVAAGLERLQNDPDLADEYRGCREMPKALILKLFKRHELWESLHIDEREQHGFTRHETDLFPYINLLKRTRVADAARRELLTIRAAGKQSGTFNALLVSLSLPPAGQMVNERYRVYGDDKEALLEETINRYADYRANRDPGTYTHLEEVCLFSMLDPDMEIKPPFNRQQIDERIRMAAEAGVMAGEGDREGLDGYRMSDAHGHDDHEAHGAANGIDGHQLIHDIGTLQQSMKRAALQVEEAKELVRLNTSGKKETDLLHELKSQSTELGHALQMTGEWKRCAQIVENWAHGHIAPADFVANMRIFTGGKDFEALAELADIPVNERKDLAQKALEEIKGQVDTWNTQAQAINDYVEKLRNADEARRNQGAVTGKWFEFFSLNQFFGAVHNVYDSYSKAWQQWNQLKESKLSKYLGDAVNGLPMSDRAKITLEMELDHKNDEVKDNFKKHLEHDLADFDHCVTNPDHPGHPGFLDVTKEDPNHFRGTLEYMASKGWLYELDIENKMVFGIPLKKGVNLPANWTDKRVEEYLRDLEQQQSKGESSEADRGKSRVNNYPDIQLMIPVLEDELKRRNYWATFGILERIVEKGKLGESPVWASVVIMDAIRNDPTARRHFPKKLLDKYGNNGLPNGMVHRMFKLDRHDIERFQKQKNLDFGQAGLLAATIKSVEGVLEKRQKDHGLPPLPRSQKLRMIGQVIAGQLVTGPLGRWHVHLYENIPAFNAYRQFLENFSSSLEPSKIDDDYYNPKNDISELHLNSSSSYNQILNVASQGKFENEEKAKNFLESLIKNYQLLKSAAESDPKLRPAYINFVKATRKKLNDFYSGMTLANATQVIEYKGTAYPADKYLFLELVRCRLLDPKKNNYPPGQLLQKQVTADHNTVYDSNHDLD